MPKSSFRRRVVRNRATRKNSLKQKRTQRATGPAAGASKLNLYKPNGQRCWVSAKTILSQGFPLPANFWTTHRYTSAQLLSTNPDGTFGVDLYYRINSMYQPQTNYPNQHQPYGFDQMRAFYNNRCVYKVGVQITVTFSTNRSNGLGVYFKKGANTLAIQGITPAQVRELPNAVVVGAGTDSMPYDTFETEIYIADLVGRKRSDILTEVDYSEAGNSTVSEECFMGVAAGNWVSSGPQDIHVQVTLTQYVRWNVLLNPGPS